MNAAEFVHWVAHSDEPYDPAKAHAYYLLTRQLKGRAPGVGPPVPVARSIRPKPGPVVKPRPVVRHAPAAKPKKSKAQLQAEADAKVAALKVRLAKLKVILSKLVAEANQHKQKTSSTAEKSPAHRTHETAKEKAEKKAYDYTHRHDPKKTTVPTEKQLQGKIATVNKQISSIHQQLQTAIDNARKTAAKSALVGQPAFKPGIKK
jgi:hypothetical protein